MQVDLAKAKLKDNCYPSLVMRELRWPPVPEQSWRLMMVLLCTLNADNRQIFLWIGLGIGLVSWGSFWLSMWLVVERVFFLFPFFLWWAHSFSYVRGFPMRLLHGYEFNEACEDTGFFNCQNNGRLEVTDRRRHARR